MSNAFGQVQYLTLDFEDRATNTVDANGVSLSLTYDALGRVLTRTSAAGGLSAYTRQGRPENRRDQRQWRIDPLRV